ncbi:MAG TPA: hypothetical protein VLM92_01455, partial [Romboutsia sp.]|nr:hypothetical protein [Romboutsia sp.]
MKLKIWQFTAALCIFLLLVRITEIYNLFVLLFKYLYLLIFADASIALSYLNFSLIDNIISAILIISIPLFIYIKRNKYVFLQRRLNFSYIVIIILSSFFIFAPIVSTSNPDFEKNLNVTKLLPPFSTVRILSLIRKPSTSSNPFNKFLDLKDEVIQNSYNDYVIFVDSVKPGNKVTYYQKGIAYQLDSAQVKYSGNEPDVGERIFILGT